MYAIVDIETTGGFASGSGITEISIISHDGSSVTDCFESLINPGHPIPLYIQALTGITDDMVAAAPSFGEIAGTIHARLEGKIFVAHNVNFDFSFLRHHLGIAGIEYQAPKLCTVKLARKIFPGLSSYSLGKLCRYLQIPISGRHRATGDAEATVKLLELLLCNDRNNHVASLLRRNSAEQSLPMNLPAEQVRQLPMVPGIYYFHDSKDNILYVGKAINIRKRVLGHFTNNHPGRRKQEFLRLIHKVSCKTCSTELMSLILESVEIHRLWPAYNRAQKKYEQVYGLFSYPDQNGYIRLCVEKKRKFHHPLHTFHITSEGTLRLRSLVKEFQLCPSLCFLESGEGPCSGRSPGTCNGACEKEETPQCYNQRVEAAVESLRDDLPSFAILDKGCNGAEQSCILMEHGTFYGMGHVPLGFEFTETASLKPFLAGYADNAFIRQQIYQFAERHPDKVISFT